MFPHCGSFPLKQITLTQTEKMNEHSTPRNSLHRGLKYMAAVAIMGKLVSPGTYLREIWR
jgi:hypothetical protein